MDTQLSITGQSNYISLDEAANQLGVTTNGLRQYMVKHPDTRRYLAKEKYNGRRRFVISVEALPHISFSRNLDEKNQSVSQFRELKKNIADHAIVEMKQRTALSTFSNEEIIKEMTLRLNSKVEDHEVRLAELENGNPKLTQGQRERLNERVRLLAVRLDREYPQVWLLLHEQTGRKTIDDYVFEDYGMAIRWLKRVFRDNNLTW